MLSSHPGFSGIHNRLDVFGDSYLGLLCFSKGKVFDALAFLRHQNF